MESTREMLLVPRWSCQSREVARHGHTNWVDPSNPLAVGCAHVVAGGAAVDLLDSIPFICLLKEGNQHKMFAQVYCFKFEFLKLNRWNGAEEGTGTADWNKRRRRVIDRLA
jgi:hypothetical protein